MATSTGTEWYKTGTVAVTQSSVTVTGTGTTWSSAGLKAGDIFTVDDSTLYEIAEVNSNTTIKLNKAYTGATASGIKYAIIRNFAATVPSELAARVALMTNKYESYIDADLEKITGPAANIANQYKGTWSAGYSYSSLDMVLSGSKIYVATANHTSTSDNGPTGASSVWMELSSNIPTDVFGYNSAGLHNSIYRGKNLGSSITSEQLANIANGSFKDLWIGDFWTLSLNVAQDDVRNLKVTILEFDYLLKNAYGGAYQNKHCVLCLIGSIGNSFDSVADNSKGFAGTRFYKSIAPVMQASLENLLGESHVQTLQGDTVSSDNQGNYINNEYKVTLPPVKLFAPLANVSSPPGIFVRPLSHITYPIFNHYYWTRDYVPGTNAHFYRISNDSFVPSSGYMTNATQGYMYPIFVLI